MWREEDNALHRTYTFVDFVEAMAFMNEAAFRIEKINHHPEWSNVYNRVIVKLTTHDAGHTVTDKDRNLAKILDEIYSRYAN